MTAVEHELPIGECEIRFGEESQRQAAEYSNPDIGASVKEVSVKLFYTSPDDRRHSFWQTG